MMAKDIGSLIGLSNRYARGEGAEVEFQTITGIDAKVITRLFNECNILDANGRVIYGTTPQDILNALTLFMAIAAGVKAQRALEGKEKPATARV